MDRVLIKSALTISALLLSAVPALPSTLLNFTFQYGGASTATVSGGVLTASTLDFTQIGGTSVTGTIIQQSCTPSCDSFQVSLGANQTFDGVTTTGSSAVLFDFTTALATVQTAGSGYAVTYGAATTISSSALNSSFKSDLGLTSPVIAVFLGTNDAFNVNSSGNVTSDVLSVTLSNTPEPASFVMLGTGLIGLAIGFRIRSRRSAKPSISSVA